MTMGHRLRELRLNRSLSQEEVARHIGITRSAYSHYEINNRQPVYETLIKLAEFFDVSLDYIIGGNPSSHPEDGTLSADSQEVLRLLKKMNQEQRKQSIGMLTDMVNKERVNG
ncbi:MULTISPECIES: helix-turn-helix domain-containing protein [Cohnella]|uniref:helix-turn-helix domain-containing protein n=1 Tax=Cohnella TaxID=329857 RepID=UPI0009BC03FF|nr:MULTISPECIES: helix-turn-helix transcriptional regulator [Cohnella]MBN2984001.1 helix-turn-helix transcriptional regulator [Cohnella algarum]